jgi:gas vesicle protein GvpL/GvpF
MGLHVYAIGRVDGIELPQLSGILDQPVRALASEPLAAIVSDGAAGAVRAERRHIAASQRVMNALNAQFDLLPVAFGTIAESEEELIQFIDEHREALTGQLERVAGRAEMSVQLSLDVSDPIAFLVAATPELKMTRDRLFNRRTPPTYDERIRLGQLCEDALQRYRETQTAQLSATLAPVCAEILSLPVRRDKEVANLAILVPRAAIGRFQDAVDSSAARLSDDLALIIGGPWPPYNFVQINL